MQRKAMGLMAALAVSGCVALGGCVVAPPRARVVAVAPAPVWVWVPGYWYAGVRFRGHWRYR